MALPAELSDSQRPNLCQNYVYKGRCGFASCRYQHDDLARLEAKGKPTPSRSTSSSQWSESSAAKGPPASIRFLLEGESIRSNPYLKEFAAASWLPRLVAAPECSKLFNVQGKRLRKELTEAFGLLHACGKALRKLRAEGHRVTIVDLCCGKGFSSLVLACSFPEAQVLAVDRNAHMDLSHFNLCENLSFRHLDLESPSLAPDCAQMLLDAAPPGAGSGRPGVLLLVGVHLCGMLSVRAIQLFAAAAGPTALVLAPCCLDKRLPGVKRRAKRLGVNPYTFWCLSLLFEELPSCRRELFQDDDVLSERNSFILAVK